MFTSLAEHLQTSKLAQLDYGFEVIDLK